MANDDDGGKVRRSPKRTLMSVFEESVQVDRKLNFDGPDKLRPDSRYAIEEIAADHVVFRLIGDEVLVIPYSAIIALKVAPTALTVRYR